jgi:hypothetical protein
MRMGELPSVSGALLIDGGRAAVPEGTIIGLDEETERRPILRPVSPDGTFVFDAVPPGRYRPILAGSDPAPHLRGVTVDGVRSKDGAFEIAGPAKLEVAATLAGGAVSGVAVRGGEPVPGVLVELAPENSPNPYDYMVFETDSDGSFEFQRVPPGNYVLFAVEQFDDFEYANPEAVRPHLASGKAIRVEGDGKVNARLEVK